jgi:hypothetical protein
MPPAIGLTSAWAADDRAIYYIRQASGGSVALAGLHNSGFHSMEFTNLFWGRLAVDGKALSGDWADVPVDTLEAPPSFLVTAGDRYHV